jgi:hypothetical protein
MAVLHAKDNDNDQLIEQVDRWRIKRRPIPSRAEALRSLLRRALLEEEREQARESA